MTKNIEEMLRPIDKKRFYLKVLPGAGLFLDDFGNPTTGYAAFDVDFKSEVCALQLPDEDRQHEMVVRHIYAKTGIPEACLVPISEREYLANTKNKGE